ncbi:mitochondrial transcription rescue factor 1 isoform X1 [Ursus americanus]|uniref:mitochondrial transcription rescue factor 1 isoform X1 n=1 Tax=Ursus americanus TaxID=9643 RepID=UPI001E67AF73|nr:mitochondrial transcription rescue factor 1 isoform X1 [Ursus americanus]
MALTGVRLPASVLRKPDAWIGLWGSLQGTPSYKLCASWNRYLYFSSTQLNTSSCKTFLHSFFSLRLPELLISPEYIFPLSIRLKSNISSKKSTKKTPQKAEDEEDSEDESDRETSEREEELEDDPTVIKDYKDLEKVVQSFRYDVILKTGLDVGRNKVEDAFYKGELRLNGEKLWKKSRTGLLSLGCQKNIKAGSTRGKYFQMVLTAPWPPPPLHTPIHTARQGERSQRPPIRGLKTPLQSDKKHTFRGKVETEAISIGTQVAVLRCGQASDSDHWTANPFTTK